MIMIFPEMPRKMGQYFMAKLEELKKKYSFISDVRGRGLLIAVEFNKDIAEEVLYACLANGFLVNQLKPNMLRVIPPLIINKAEIDDRN